jgi:hypothetical protein
VGEKEEREQLHPAEVAAAEALTQYVVLLQLYSAQLKQSRLDLEVLEV